MENNTRKVQIQEYFNLNFRIEFGVLLKEVLS